VESRVTWSVAQGFHFLVSRKKKELIELADPEEFEDHGDHTFIHRSGDLFDVVKKTKTG